MLRCLFCTRAGGWLTVLLLVLASPARASHLLGGELTSRFLDANGPAGAPLRYELTLKVYKSCGTSLLSNVAPITIYQQDTGDLVPLTTLNYPDTASSQGVRYLNLPQRSLSDCLGPTPPPSCATILPAQSYRLQVYSGIVRLPANSRGFYALFSDYSRTAGLTNLVASVSDSFWLYANLAPPALANHSPVFSADRAVVVACAYDTTYLLNNAVDPDGDRLVYRFGQPYGLSRPSVSGAILPPALPLLPPGLPYEVGYSAIAPLGTAPGNAATIDSATGVTRLLSTQAGGQFAVAVDVLEYRTIAGREVLVGSTRRDIQLTVANCPLTAAPTLGSLPRQYTLVAGSTLQVPLTATQADGHPLQLTLISELLDGAGGYQAALDGDPGTVAPGSPAGTATRSATSSPVAGTFSFTAACTDARPTPYDVVVSVQDRGCVGKTTLAALRIVVVPPAGPAVITGAATVCGAPTTQVYTASGQNGPVSWRAVGGLLVGRATDNPVQVRWPAPGTYRLVARSQLTGACPTDSAVLAVTVLPGTPPEVSGDLTICPGGSSTLAIGGPGAPYTLTGGPAPLVGSGPFVLSPVSTTTYTVAGTAPAGGCAPTTQVLLTVRPTPPVNAGPATVPATPDVPVLLGAPPLPGYAYQWSPGTGLSDPTSAAPTLTLANHTGTPLTLSYTLTVTELATGCTATATVVVTVAADIRATVYNIITPNGDRRNDALYIDNVRSFPGSTVQVFNRWGRQVFFTTAYDNDTNSWGSGADVAPGIYYYLFRPVSGPAIKGWVEVVK